MKREEAVKQGVWKPIIRDGDGNLVCAMNTATGVIVESSFDDQKHRTVLSIVFVPGEYVGVDGMLYSRD